MEPKARDSNSLRCTTNRGWQKICHPRFVLCTYRNLNAERLQAAYARVSAAGCTLPRLTTKGWETAVFLTIAKNLPSSVCFVHLQEFERGAATSRVCSSVSRRLHPAEAYNQRLGNGSIPYGAPQIPQPKIWVGVFVWRICRNLNAERLHAAATNTLLNANFAIKVGIKVIHRSCG